jgi:hypothetical protein
MKKETPITRRNFFGWGAAIAAAFTSIQLLLPRKKEKKTVKMLTREGKLVEVDIKHLQSKVRLASKKEVQTWIWPDSPSSSQPVE